MASLPEAKLLPWGRLVLLTTNNKSDVPDHFDLLRSKHRVGRVSKRSDLLITKPFVSGLHCSIQLRGKDDRGEPVVEIEDHSLHGTYLNGKKIGLRRSEKAKKGDRINFSAPGAPGVTEIAYKLEILPSGLTKQNEELHARLSADEMSVAGRTRKRIHEELQSTQSPTTVVVSPPRPRPTKKLRLVSLSQQSSQEYASQPASQSGSAISSTPATQQSAQKQAQPSRAPGKRRRRPDDKALEELQKENAELRKQNAELQRKHADDLVVLGENNIALSKLSKQLELSQKGVEASQKEILALKKDHAEELKKTKDQAAADLAKKDEEMKKKVDELVHELDMLKETVDLIVADPTKPHHVRSIPELTKAVYDLERRKKNVEEDLVIQKHTLDQTNLTPPSKRQVAQIERTSQIQATLLKDKNELLQRQKEALKSFTEVTRQQEALNMREADASVNLSNFSGSSQSQDSIDAGQIRRARRSSQISVASNEHSEPSPPDVATTVDTPEEPKSGAPFNQRGATGATSNMPDTLSRPQLFRTGEPRTQRQQSTVKAEETKRGDEETQGPQGAFEDEETKGGDEETNCEDNGEETNRE